MSEVCAHSRESPSGYGSAPQVTVDAPARISRGADCERERLAAALAARRGTGPEVRFGVHVRNDNRERTPPLVQFKALCGPGDGGEPIITVMQPEED